jgi:predicted nucleotidyltransferase component of viral defense system
MNLFDRLVSQAIRHQADLSPLRIVVEKELLHHDILREMSAAGLLSRLTLIDGTCLRACYGSSRLSEDLDFTGGEDFRRETLSDLAKVLVHQLHAKYGLEVTVSEPRRESGNVDTWKLKLMTRPENRGLPAQKINIDICAIPSHDRCPMLLRNPYGVDMGTSGLIIQAQSREEILADKLLALALRPNRIKNRDLWDIAWLKQQNVRLPLELIPKKLIDHRRSQMEFLTLLENRGQQLQDDHRLPVDFVNEMRRFLPPVVVANTVENPAFWVFLVDLVQSEGSQIARFLKGESPLGVFRM